MKKSNKKKKDTNNSYRVQNIILTVALIMSLSMTSGLAFISFGAAVFALGFTILSFMFLFERNRRGAWENGIEKTINTLDAAHEFMARQVRKNSDDIKTLSTQKPIVLKETIKKKVKKPFSFSSFLGEEEPKQRPKTAVQKMLMQEQKKSMTQPLATTPPVIANDEKPSYYNSLSDTVVKELVGHAVKQNTMAVFMQPVLRLPEQSVRGYEVFSRVRSRPGQYIPAGRYINLARKDKTIINSIDHMMLMRCLEDIKNTAQTPTNTLFFLNISKSTLQNKLFMNRLLGFIAKNRTLAGRLVFEIGQDDFNTMSEGQCQILKGIAKLGCSLSLDHIDSLYFDLRQLHEFRVRFIKVPAADLIKKADTPSKRDMLWSIKRKLESNGIGVIAEKIENQDMMDALSTLDLHYGQGYLFGKPGLRETKKAA